MRSRAIRKFEKWFGPSEGLSCWTIQFLIDKEERPLAVKACTEIKAARIKANHWILP